MSSKYDTISLQIDFLCLNIMQIKIKSMAWFKYRLIFLIVKPCNNFLKNMATSILLRFYRPGTSL